MANGSTAGASRRNLANILVILTGLGLLAISIWPGEPNGSPGSMREMGNPQLLWLVHALAGAAALGAIVAAQRWQHRALARALLIAAAGALLVTLAIYQDFGPRALLTNLVPAALLLFSASVIGPIPPPSPE